MKLMVIGMLAFTLASCSKKTIKVPKVAEAKDSQLSNEYLNAQSYDSYRRSVEENSDLTEEGKNARTSLLGEINELKNSIKKYSDQWDGEFRVNVDEFLASISDNSSEEEKKAKSRITLLKDQADKEVLNLTTKNEKALSVYKENTENPEWKIEEIDSQKEKVQGLREDFKNNVDSKMDEIETLLKTKAPEEAAVDLSEKINEVDQLMTSLIEDHSDALGKVVKAEGDLESAKEGLSEEEVKKHFVDTNIEQNVTSARVKINTVSPSKTQSRWDKLKENDATTLTEIVNFETNTLNPESENVQSAGQLAESAALSVATEIATIEEEKNKFMLESQKKEIVARISAIRKDVQENRPSVTILDEDNLSESRKDTSPEGKAVSSKIEEGISTKEEIERNLKDIEEGTDRIAGVTKNTSKKAFSLTEIQTIRSLLTKIETEKMQLLFDLTKEVDQYLNKKLGEKEAESRQKESLWKETSRQISEKIQPLNTTISNLKIKASGLHTAIEATDIDKAKKSSLDQRVTDQENLIPDLINTEKSDEGDFELPTQEELNNILKEVEAVESLVGNIKDELGEIEADLKKEIENKKVVLGKVEVGDSQKLSDLLNLEISKLDGKCFIAESELDKFRALNQARVHCVKDGVETVYIVKATVDNSLDNNESDKYEISIRKEIIKRKVTDTPDLGFVHDYDENETIWIISTINKKGNISKNELLNKLLKELNLAGSGDIKITLTVGKNKTDLTANLDKKGNLTIVQETSEETIKTIVGENGKPIKGAKALFKFDSAVINPGYKAVLDLKVDEIKESKNVSLITVVGHADPVGSDDYNLKLSERRANAVRRYLVSKGVSVKINAVGVGESQCEEERKNHSKCRKVVISITTNSSAFK